jgi:hypothetical protein
MSWWLVASAVVSAYGSMQAGKARAAVARAQAAQLEEQKKDAEVTAMQEHNIRLANLQSFMAVNESIAGVMGRDIGSDRSLKAIREKACREADTAESRARLQFVSEQSQRSMSIGIANMQARNAKRAGRYKAMSSLLTAGYQYSQIE